MSSASFAVIVPTYNRAGYVRAALDSILFQDGAPEEVIVVDDGSTDDTPAVLAGYGDRIRVIAQPNAGVSAARNAGAAAATADWLTFLDFDDLWCANRMALLRADLARAARDVVAHVADVLFRGVGAARDFCAVARIGVAGAAFRRDVFADPGGFDPAFRTDADTDLADRMAVRGPVIPRGDVVAEVIRRPGGTDAPARLRRDDPLRANDLKQRLIRAALARADHPGDRAPAGAALSQRAGPVRAAGQAGHRPTSWQSVRAHPSPAKGGLQAGRAVLHGRHASRTDGVDRTAAG